MQEVTSNDIARILQDLRNINEQYSMALAGQEEAENYENDLRHDLELKCLSYHERAKVAEKMRDALRERRKNKDMAELLKSFSDWYTISGNLIKQLERVLGDMRRIEEKHRNRTYMYRTRQSGERENP